MKYFNFTVNFLLITCGFFAPSCFAKELSEKYPDLIMHGEVYSNACVPERLETLRSMLLTTDVNVRKEDATKEAWHVINTILCSPNNAENRAYIKKMLQKSVRINLESTGEAPDVQVVERNDELVNDILAAGHAWKANIQVEIGKILLQYFASEACVEAVTLTLKGGKWSVAEFGVACD